MPMPTLADKQVLAEMTAIIDAVEVAAHVGVEPLASILRRALARLEGVAAEHGDDPATPRGRALRKLRGIYVDALADAEAVARFAPIHLSEIAPGFALRSDLN